MYKLKRDRKLQQKADGTETNNVYIVKVLPLFQQIQHLADLKHQIL